ncbi:hypothetical protein OG520_44905 (plasmid) [Streptomyces sp. NBC_00984]|nr:hypothetical protein OG520_44905 [Streptomyces sp. NBC_00984]
MAEMRRRVYGAYHDDPDPWEQPGQRYVELVGGPLDGQLLDVTSWPEAHLADGGACLITEASSYGPGGRADYEGRPGDPGRWDWAGDSP